MNYILKVLFFKVLRLTDTSRNGFVHFLLPLRAFHVLTIDAYVARINAYFPFFVSFSVGLLGSRGFQAYLGLKADATSIDEYNGHDFMLSAAFRIIELKKDCKVRSMAGN